MVRFSASKKKDFRVELEFINCVVVFFQVYLPSSTEGSKLIFSPITSNFDVLQIDKERVISSAFHTSTSGRNSS